MRVFIFMSYLLLDGRQAFQVDMPISLRTVFFYLSFYIISLQLFFHGADPKTLFVEDFLDSDAVKIKVGCLFLEAA